MRFYTLQASVNSVCKIFYFQHDARAWVSNTGTHMKIKQRRLNFVKVLKGKQKGAELSS